MEYIKYSVETVNSGVELVCAVLAECGIDGVEIVDNVPLTEKEQKEMFTDVPVDLNEDDESASVNFYLEPGEEKLLSKVKEELETIKEMGAFGTLAVTSQKTDDSDWLDNWKQYWKPFNIDDDIVIKPTWESYERKGNELILEIDPGRAFGTGSHETTRLCILALKKYLKPGDNVLDVGSGSGILSIAAEKFGAGAATGYDVDPAAVENSRENAAQNNCRACTFKAGNIIDDADLRRENGVKLYDVAVANIFADIIMPLSGVIPELLKENALFISSGIINTRFEEVKETIVKNGFEIIETTSLGDWYAIIAKHA